eukprot:7387582-Prymnesium_polylepis.1
MRAAHTRSARTTRSVDSRRAYRVRSRRVRFRPGDALTRRGALLCEARRRGRTDGRRIPGQHPVRPARAPRAPRAHPNRRPPCLRRALAPSCPLWPSRARAAPAYVGRGPARRVSCRPPSRLSEFVDLPPPGAP